MPHPRDLGHRSLLLLLTSAISACGATGAVLAPEDAGQDVAADGAPRGDSAAPADAGVACDAGSTAVADGACVPAPASVRRPFLVGASQRSAATAKRRDWSTAIGPAARAIDTVTTHALAASWLRDGLEEHASVAAFARFTMHLLSIGAPPDLIQRSQRASLDEIRHARACFGLAERYSGRARGPSSLSVTDAMAPASLAQIAALTAEEGCVGETLGAVLAAEQLAVARDPEVVAILRKIAADEARHAELAWRFARWAVIEGGDEVRQAIESAAERAMVATLAMEIRSYEGIDLDAWHGHGRLTCREARAVAERAIREVVRPCLAALMLDATAGQSISRPGAGTIAVG